MTARELRSALEILGAAWSQPFPREQVTVYAELLADIPPAELLAAVRALSLTHEFRPAVATIRRRVVSARLALPSADEAAEQREQLADWEQRQLVPWGAQEKPPPRPAVHPTVQAAWDTVGPDAPAWSFNRAWDSICSERVRSAAAGKLDLPELTR